MTRCCSKGECESFIDTHKKRYFLRSPFSLSLSFFLILLSTHLGQVNIHTYPNFIEYCLEIFFNALCILLHSLAKHEILFDYHVRFIKSCPYISPQLLRWGTKNEILLIQEFFILSVYMDSHSRAALNNVATLNEVDMVSIFELSKRFIQHFWLFYHSVCEGSKLFSLFLASSSFFWTSWKSFEALQFLYCTFKTHSLSFFKKYYIGSLLYLKID